MCDNHDAERKAQLRTAIRLHLERYPLAGDTPEGIVACWLPARGYEDAPQFIGDVVGAMVADNELVAHHLPDGRVLYVRGPMLSART